MVLGFRGVLGRKGWSNFFLAIQVAVRVSRGLQGLLRNPSRSLEVPVGTVVGNFIITELRVKS